MMNCREAHLALVECARRGDAPEGELREHLAACDACSDRWKAERDLAVHFGAMAALAEASEASSRARRDARAAALLLSIAEKPRLEIVPPRRATHSARWLAAAAALLLAVGGGYTLGTRDRHTAPKSIRVNTARAGSAVLYEISADTAALSGDDFIAVPYAMPMSPGETLSVVHSQLRPETLAGMGIDVDPAWLNDDSGEISADVVVGQDGLPRAVRIADTTDF